MNRAFKEAKKAPAGATSKKHLERSDEMNMAFNEAKTAPAGATSKKHLEWSDEMHRPFKEAKTALARATILRHPRPGAELAMSADAAGEAVGAVLQQRPREGGAWEPLAYFSKKLRPPDMKYSAFDRELLAVYLGICHF